MANHVRRQIREAAVTALTGLTTTGTRVKSSLVYPMQDGDLPGLRIDVGPEQIVVDSITANPTMERTLQLVVQACVKQTATYNDTIDAILKEVEIAIAAHQALGGAKHVLLQSITPALAGEGEKPIAVTTLVFEAPYYTTLAAPDVAV